MSQIVHVIKASGTRFQYTFADKDSPEVILQSLARIKHHFGYNGTVKKRDEKNPDLPEVDYGDQKSGFAFDSPDTIICIGTSNDDGTFTETKRLKGPAIETPVEVKS